MWPEQTMASAAEKTTPPPPVAQVALAPFAAALPFEFISVFRFGNDPNLFLSCHHHNRGFFFSSPLLLLLLLHFFFIVDSFSDIIYIYVCV